MWFLYYISLYAFLLAIRISSLWSEKSLQWLEGRKNWKWSLSQLPEKENSRIWFHVSSLGEFEQAKPVIEMIKRERPEIEIILSFFSPSGYNVRSHYQHATVIYLPLDLPGNATKFIELVRPDLAVFVKYDLWPGYLKALHQKKIPSILISAYWSPRKKFNSWSLPLTEKYLKRFKHIFLQRNDHLHHFKEKGYKNLSVAGDTRIDRSLLLPNEIELRLSKIFHELDSYDLVAGSTWPKDEELLFYAIDKLNLRTIIVPHDVSADNIKRLTSKLKKPFQLYSNIETDKGDHKVLIMDCVGLLSVLYSVGKIAYVGGGFGKGIHNILEPAAHKKPILFGPKHLAFPEAGDLIHEGAAWKINTEVELVSVLHTLLIADNAIRSGQRAYAYLENNDGATEIVTRSILESIPYRVSA